MDLANVTFGRFLLYVLGFTLLLAMVTNADVLWEAVTNRVDLDTSDFMSITLRVCRFWFAYLVVCFPFSLGSWLGYRRNSAEGNGDAS
ncbi:MAG: hypothetical protein AAAFM81_11045 [Pseudomonadota bacterium]